ncbi:MAG: permease [Mariniblastus sp.]|nr:permease [Mariniblastus sp.]
MIEYFLAGGTLRGAQVIMDASIWIAFGCFIAAIFRNMLGPEKTRSLFGNQSRFGLLIGWGIGMLLPVCSLGVIPVVRELHRSGVKQGTIIAFGLTAPLFNPLSILYGLSLSDPIAIVVFSAAAMLVVTGLGMVWGKFVASDTPANLGSSESANAVATSGIRRSLAVIRTASTEMISWSIVFIAIGILASAATSVAFEHGSLQGETEPDNIFAPAFMACYVAPVYSTPLLAMSQIGGMFQHGNSVGAAFSLLILGAGINIGLLCWFGSAFGLRRVAMFFGLLLSLTLTLAYAMDKPLYPKGVSPAGHTHAFDVYTHPFHKGQPHLWDTARDSISEYQEKSGGAYGVRLLGILILIGIAFRVVESRWDLEGWFARQPKAPSKWDIALPAWVIGMVACVGLVVASIFGTYVYYPGPTWLLKDLSAINANCVVAAKTGDWEAVDKWVVYCDDLSRRLEVGVFLRTGTISDFKRAKASAYRDKLDELRDDIAVGQTSRIQEQAIELLQSYQQMSAAFRDVKPRQNPPR